MQIEDQVVSLELAKRLKELGVESESLFYYLNIDGEGKYYIYYNEYMPEDFEYEGHPISAYTVAELGEMLPQYIEDDAHNIYEIVMRISDEEYKPNQNLELILETPKRYEVGYVRTNPNNSNHGFKSTDTKEVNARAEALIFLIENGYMKNE